MGDLTRAEIRDEVTRNLGNILSGLSPANTAAAVARLNRAIDLAQRWIGRQHSWHELRQFAILSFTAVGVPAVDRFHQPGVAAGFKVRKILSIMVIEQGGAFSRKLEYVEGRTWDKLVPRPYVLQTGIVTHYTILAANDGGMTVEWWMIPAEDFVYELRYERRILPFASETATSTFRELDDLIIARATESMFRSMGAMEDTAVWSVEVSRLLGIAIKDDRTIPDYTPRPTRILRESSPDPIDYWRDPFMKESP